MAGFDAGSIIAHVKADISDFKDKMSDAQEHTGKLHSGLDKLAGGVKVLAKGMAIGGAAAAAFGGLAVKEFSDAETSLTNLNTVIKQTGKITGVTTEQAIDLANSLQKVTKFSDEMIMEGESLLATFNNIGKDVFPEATEVMLDMSTVLGQDVKSSAIQLGKALQDPIQGVTALRRVGVSLTDQQEEMIKKLVESGKTMEAQRMVLDILKGDNGFGGAAKAAGKTFAGQITIAKNTFSDFMENIGQAIVQKVSPMIQKFNEWVEAAGGVDGALRQISENIKNFGINVFNFFKPAIDLLIAVWKFLQPNFSALARTIVNELWPALKRLWDTLEPLLLPALKGVAAAIGVALIGAIWLLINVINIVTNAISWLVSFLSNLIQWGKNVRQMFIDVAGTLAFWIPHAVQQVIGWIDSMIGKFRQIEGSIRNALSGVFNAITAPFRDAFNWIKDRVQDVINKLKGLNPFQRHSPSLVDLITKGTSAIVKQYDGMFGDLTSMASRFNAIQLAPAAVPAPNQNNSVKTQIYGNVNIGSEVDANNFIARLTRNQELASKGLTTL